MSQFKHYAPVSDKQLGFYIDSSRCSGCKACQVACKDKNNLEVGRRFRRVYEVNGGNFIPTGQGGVSNNVFAYTLSISCNHCADPICTKTVRPRRCTSVRETALCALIQISASAAATVRGHALTAHHSSTSRPGKCQNAISAWISRRRGSSPSVWQPVHSKRLNSGRLMNCGRSMVRSVT
ncbi:anaerobic dimethyl sulfoxide reductase subunit B [Enterobacter roggenkampii MGH 34]|nr:anaerobic dimethyl sulfoxide reductase subunit B [Enterobacter roggenkampii MGH 34]